MADVELLTNTTAFDALHASADSRRALVRVDRQALLNLLIDHSVMVKALGPRAAEKAPARRRLRLHEPIEE